MPYKREDAISWDAFFMCVAQAAAKRSKDPNTQVGACIAASDNRILSVGYNGSPRGISDDDFPWAPDPDDPSNPLKDKHNMVIHAEMNAILNYRGSLADFAGATAYVTLFPCRECAKTLAHIGVHEVVYADDKYDGTEDNIVAKHVLAECGVVYRHASAEAVTSGNGEGAGAENDGEAEGEALENGERR
jgi:dCMP deaminase